MNNVNVKPSDRAKVVGVINPVSTSVAVNSGWLSAADFISLLAIVAIGAIAATGTVDIKFEKATDGAGSGATDVTEKVITQLVDTDDNKQVLINLFTNDLGSVGGTGAQYTHVRLVVTAATAASLVSAVVLGFDQRFELGTHATTVKEVE